MSLRHSSLRVVAAVACAAACTATGCADDEAPRAAVAERPNAYVSRSELERLLERELMLQRSLRRDERLSSDLDPEPVDGIRFAVVPSGREFDVVFFATPEDAEDATQDIRRSDMLEDGGAFRRAANVVAVFPEDPEGVDSYQVAAEVLARVDRACAEPGDPEFGEFCFGVADAILPDAGNRTPGPDDPGPPGDGTQPGEFLEAGSTATLGGLLYTPVSTRQLNPSLRPDQAILEGVEVDRTGGPLLVAVMLRVCNESGRPRTPTDELMLVDSFGNRLKPVELPADNPLAYRPRELAPGQCVPAESSAPDATLAGGAVVFRVPLEVRRNPPLALEITSASGEQQSVAVDL